MSGAALLGLEPERYVPHPIHGGDAVYPETNCYTDVIIELLHARGDEPLLAMGSVFSGDFEGDQFTFFKPAPEDLEALFGVRIHEMQLYRPLVEHVLEQLRAGRTMTIEADSFYLPDTAATSYRREHVKSSIAIEALDHDARELRYFHNRSLHALSGDDYDGVFRLGRPYSADVLAPYAELVRFDAGPRLSGDALHERAVAQLRLQLARRPARNPIAAFSEQLLGVLPVLLAGAPQDYHDYAFATVRMLGAGAELGARMCETLFAGGADPVARPLHELAAAARVLSLKLARRRPFDAEPNLTAMAGHWDRAMAGLDELAG